jgi:spore coat assembly protein SafA
MYYDYDFLYCEDAMCCEDTMRQIPGVPGVVTIYIVQPGDTLYSIANRYNVSLQRLIAVNRLENPEIIYPGMRIIIPLQ